MTKIQEIPTRIVRTINRLIHPLSADERKQVIAEIAPTASPGFDFFLLVVLSCSIATLGLVTNSPAVIIGAMLLAPLMSPIIGIGLASITGDDKLIKTSASALLRGAGLAILLSYLMTLVNRFLPFVALQELPDEVLARIRPTPIDLVIALAGGLAAAYAMTRPNLSAALPGVAIATALMPPLCTIGIGIALNRWNVAGGASLLFITNAVTIAFASALVFFLRGFSAEARRAGQRLPRSLILSAILVAILLVPLSYYSVKFFRDAADNRLINTVVSQEVARLGDVQLVDVQVIHQDGTLDMVITLRTNIALDYEKVVVLQEAIVAGINRPVSLRVEQVIAEELNPLIPPTPIPTPTATFTQTLGPSPTYTPSPTATQTASPTVTATPSPTPTPVQARVALAGLPPLKLYQSPGGPAIGQLRAGQWLTILYGRQEFEGFVWIEVMDEEGRIGWLAEIYLKQVTPTLAP
jgi:uncharacterized hydrophobic protein (TIGR00271 family)